MKKISEALLPLADINEQWEVLFLGANFDVATYTQSAGLDMTKMRNFDTSNLQQRTAMYADLTSSTAAYAMTGAAINLTEKV